MTDIKKSELQHQLDYHKNELLTLVKENTKSMINLTKDINNNNINNNPGSSSIQKPNLSNKDQIVESNDQHTGGHISSSVLISSSSELPKENSILGYLSEMKELYNDFLAE